MVSDFQVLDPAGGKRLDAAVFAGLALELHDTEGVQETVTAVMEFSLLALGCTHSGIVLRQKAGPVVDAYRDGTVVWIHDTVGELRWPEWALRAAELGVRTVLHLPLRVGDETVGVLSAYHDCPDAFSTDDEAIAHILARHASVAVANARRVQNLGAAMDARKVVGQAMGILMERFDLDSDRAFGVLRRYSQDYNLKLRDVAERLIETRRLPAASDPPVDRPQHSRTSRRPASFAVPAGEESRVFRRVLGRRAPVEARPGSEEKRWPRSVFVQWEVRPVVC